MSVRGGIWVSYLTFVYGCFAYALAGTPGGAKLGALLIVAGVLGFCVFGLFVVRACDPRAT